MAFNLAPFLKQRFFTKTGTLAPLVGGKVYTYQAGTTTPQATYTDSTGVTPNSNPVILDAFGEADIWLDVSLSYKFIVKDSDDNLQDTIDNIIGLSTNNSVATNSIQEGAVTTPKLANNAVTSEKLLSDAAIDANRAVTTDHIRNSAITRAKLAVGAVAKRVVASKITTFTSSSSEDDYECSASGGAFTGTLFTADSSYSGFEQTFTKTDSTFNQVTITDGASFTKKLSTQGESIRVRYNGSSWVLISRYIPCTETVYAMTIGGTTSAPTKGTTTIDRATWCRVGSFAKITYSYKQTVAGSAGSGAYLFPLPSGMAFDTNFCTVDTLAGTVLGLARANNVADNVSPSSTIGEVYAHSSGNLAIAAASGAAAKSFVGSGFISLSSTNIVISFSVLVPISGWEG